MGICERVCVFSVFVVLESELRDLRMRSQNSLANLYVKPYPFNHLLDMLLSNLYIANSFATLHT